MKTTALQSIRQFARPYLWHLGAALVLVLCSSVTLLAFPFLAGKLLDVANGQVGIFFTSIKIIAGYMLVIIVLQGVFSYGRIRVLGYASERIVSDMRQALYAHLLKLPLAFYNKARGGDLITRLSADSAIVYQGLATQLVEWVRQVVIVVVGAGVLLSIAPRLSLMLLGVLPLLVLLGVLFGRWVRKYSKERQNKQGEADTIAQETLQLIATIKAFGAESLEVKRYEQTQGSFVQAALLGISYRALFVSLLIVIMLGGITAVMGYGAILVQADRMSTGDLLSFVLYATFIGGSMATLGDAYSQWQKVLGAFERLTQIFSESTEVSLMGGEKRVGSGDLVLDRVSFHYVSRPDLLVLDEVSFSVPKGNRVAIVGSSGGGKSTLAALLMRYYDPTGGDIYLGGVALSSIDPRYLRKEISLVPQEPILLADSVAQNLRYGKQGASLAEMKVAAAQAHALSFIEQLPAGFDTPLGDRGVMLSSGQRQRVAIARAILKDAPLLILDEATSALDSSSEKVVQLALDALCKNRTTLIIAHRLATVQHADHIYVLQDGKIQESGTHTQLYAHKGLYHQLIKDQTLH